MAIWREATRRRVLVTHLALALAAALASVAHAELPDTRAVFDLIVNTVPRGEIEVRLAGEDVWVDLARLRDAGVGAPPGEHLQDAGRTFVRLASLAPAVTYRVDEQRLALSLTVDPSMLGRTRVALGTSRPEGLQVSRATSAFLNYGATIGPPGARSASLEGGISFGRALATSTWFTSQTGALRGQTSLTFDDQRRLNRLVVGDSYASTGVLGGAVQLAGATFSRDYSLDPYFVRYATFGLSGAVITPSRLEVYVNDQLVRVAELPPGSYQLEQLQLPTGAANTRVVVRDAFGGAQEFGGAYYVTTNVLARGLHQFQYAAGVERLRPFETSWDYGRAVALGSHRFGVTDSLTLGGRAEARGDLFSGGPVVAARLGRFGAFEAAGALSRHDGHTAGAVSLAYEYITRAGSVAAAVRHAAPGYRTLASAAFSAIPRDEVAFSGTLRVAPRTTLGASWQALDYDDAIRTRRAGLSANVSLSRRLFLHASASRAAIAGVWSTSLFTGLTYALGGDRSAGVSLGIDEGRSQIIADLQQSAPRGSGLGYRLRTSTTAESSLFDGELRARHKWGELELRQTIFDGHPTTEARVSGALVALGGRVAATRVVRDGFVLVRVPGVSGVRTFLSNQPVGRTDARGDLIITELLAYYGNQISIADSDVPVDRSVPANRQLVAPPFRGGAIAVFEAPREWRAAGRFVTTSGARPSNQRVRVKGPSGPLEATTGPAGEFYVEGLPPGAWRAIVGSGDAVCEARLVIEETDAPVVDLGEVACTPGHGQEGGR